MDENEQEGPLPDYPKKGRVDHWLDLQRGVLGCVPQVGSGLQYLHDICFGSPAQEKRDAWCDDVGSRLRRVESVVTPEKLAAFVLGAARVATVTTSEEKRQRLRNAAVNYALGLEKGDRAEYFRSLIEAFTPDHFLVVELFSEKRNGRVGTGRHGEFNSSVVKIMRDTFPGLEGKDDGYLEVVVQEVLDKGLTEFSREESGASGPVETARKHLDGPRLSKLGREFLAFVSEPEQSGD